MKQLMRDLAKPLIFRRRFHAYCVGTPKSGTQSVARMFADEFRSMHEPRATQLVEALLAHGSGRMADTEMADFLKSRDRRLWLEMEASHPLHQVISVLVGAFPKSQYILTVRDPYTWVASEVNQQIHTQNNELWATLENQRYRPGDYEYQSEDEALRRAGRFPLAAYLDYWERHNTLILNSVPTERLLVVETSRLSDDVGRLSKFLGIDEGLVDLTRSHSHSRSRRYMDFWASLDRAYVEHEVQTRCGDVMARLLPHIGSIDDAISA